MFQLLLVIIYLAFISLGLPDSLLGSAWPTMYQEFFVLVSYAGGISMIIAVGTIVSSLQSDRLIKRFGTGKVTAGRAFSGFLTMKLNDTQMIRLGQGFILFGIALLFLPFGNMIALLGLIFVGLGCVMTKDNRFEDVYSLDMEGERHKHV